MTCPRCSVSEISPLTGKCDLCGFSVATAVVVEPADLLAELATRQLAHEFTFGERIGRGRESAVYRATELGSGRSVILKVILRRNAEPDVAEAFRTLMATLADFDHPHLIPVLRHGSTDSLFWFATEDRGTVSLAHKLQQDGPMEPKACRRLLTQVVSALDYLHRHGLVHGAVKAENVLISRDGWVLLADPNFIRPRWRRTSRATPVIVSPTTPAPGTPIVHDPVGPWVAPEEQERGERLPAADQYALAVLTIECLAGAEAESVVDPLALAGPTVPPRMRRALERALDPVPTRRFPGVTDFLWALQEDVAATIESPMPRQTSEVVMVQGWTPPVDGTRPLVLIARGVVALVVLGALALAAPSVRDLLRPRPQVVSAAQGPLVADPIAPSTIAPTPSTGAPAVTAPVAVDAPAAPSSPAGTAPRARPAPAGGSASRPGPGSAPAAVASPVTPAPAPAPVASGGALLFVNASPWGQVYVDGVLIGNTPRANIALAAGSHVLRVSREGFATFERSIRVAPGDTVRITDIVLTPGRP